MSLIAFHKFLITTAILFSLGFAIRQISEFQVTGERLTLITAIAFGAAGVALVFYLRHLGAILHLPSPRADLRPFMKSERENLSGRFLGSSGSLDEADAADTLLVSPSSDRTKSKKPRVKANGHGK